MSRLVRKYFNMFYMFANFIRIIMDVYVEYIVIYSIGILMYRMLVKKENENRAKFISCRILTVSVNLILF